MRTRAKMIALHVTSCVLIGGALAQDPNIVANTLSVGNGTFQVGNPGKTTITTTFGGPLLQIHQLGDQYGSTPNDAALMLLTDGPSVNNYLISGASGGGFRFSLRADGQMYLNGNLGIGTPTPGVPIDIVSGNVTAAGQKYIASGARNESR